MTNKLLRIEYFALSRAVEWDWIKNPKLHDQEQIIESFQEYGFQDPPKFDGTLNDGAGGFKVGNGRVRALAAMKQAGEDPPVGIALAPGGEWAVPVILGNDLDSQELAEAFAIDHNNLTMAGGFFDEDDMAKMYNLDGYHSLLSELRQEQLPVTVSDEWLDDMLADLEGEPSEVETATAQAGTTDSQDDDSGDGSVPNEETEEEQQTTMAMVGEWIFPISRWQYNEVMEDLRQTCGFSNEDLQAGILGRLRVPNG